MDKALSSVWYISLLVLVWFYGIIWGTFVYWACFNAFARALKSFLNLEMMSGCDEMFFEDNKRNSLNIVAFQKFSTFKDPESFRMQIVRRSRVFPRIKSKVVKFLGRYMFKELPDEEVLNSVDKLC